MSQWRGLDVALSFDGRNGLEGHPGFRFSQIEGFQVNRLFSGSETAAENEVFSNCRAECAILSSWDPTKTWTALTFHRSLKAGDIERLAG
jgi:hypothetical protein